jgi:P27 family predicted phage terminase small subunit
MPNPRKPPDRRQRGGRTRDFGVIEGGARVVPAPTCPPGLLKDTRGKWDAYWSSSVSDAVDRVSDMPIVQRLFALYDERIRSYSAYRKSRLVKGSQGQPVVNPLAGVISKMDAEIRQIEDRLGLNPKARLQLGITMADAKRSLDELNRDLDPWEEGEESDDDDGEEIQEA